jgi:MFS family permease
VGVRWALLANALSFALSGAFLLMLPSRLRTRAEADGLLAEMLQGLRFAWVTPSIRALLVGTFLLVAFLAVDNVALVFLTRDVLHATPLGYGAVAALFGAGMLLSSVLLSWLPRAPGSGSLLVAGWTLGAAATVGTGLAPNLAVAGLNQVIGGAGNGIDNVAAGTLMQEVVPGPMLGRVFGLFGTAALAGSALAYVIAGFLVDATSPRATFVIAGIAAFLTLLLVGPAMWRSRSAT